MGHYLFVDFLVSKGSHRDDIKLKDLMVPLSDEIQCKIAVLKETYGEANDSRTPCHTLNKNLAHATNCRRLTYDYAEVVKGLLPLINNVLSLIPERKLLEISTKLESITELSTASPGEKVLYRQARPKQ